MEPVTRYQCWLLLLIAGLFLSREGQINCRGGLGMKNALPHLNPAQEVTQSMGSRLFRPNPDLGLQLSRKQRLATKRAKQRDPPRQSS
jgi:hypothetical protein